MHLTRREMNVTLVGLAGTLMACRSRAAPKGADGLDARARRRGMRFGSMVRAANLKNKAFVAALTREASILVPEVELKWGANEPERGRYAYGDAESILRFCESHSMGLRGHAAFWYYNLPGWSRTELRGGGAQSVMLARVRQVMGQFRGRIAEWDVVNEAIEPHDNQPGHLRIAPFGRAMPIGYIADCFHAAHEVDPGARLYYNDYCVEADTDYEEQRRQGILALLTRLRQDGVPVHGFGSQTHLALVRPFASGRYRAFLKEVAALGFEIRLTEFDVADYKGPSDIAMRDRAIADYAQDVLDTAFDEPAVRGLIAWGLADPYSWLQYPAWARHGDGSPERPLPLDARFGRKPLWDSIARALDGAPVRPGRD